MSKLCIYVMASIVGSIGWWLGERFGFSTAFLLSGVGSLVGVYLGWRIQRDYLT